MAPDKQGKIAIAVLGPHAFECRQIRMSSSPASTWALRKEHTYMSCLYRRLLKPTVQWNLANQRLLQKIGLWYAFWHVNIREICSKQDHPAGDNSADNILPATFYKPFSKGRTHTCRLTTWATSRNFLLLYAAQKESMAQRK